MKAKERRTRSRRHAARHASFKSTGLDDFPTPAWATRVFFRYVLPARIAAFAQTINFYDPACGRGHMVRAVRSLGLKCEGSDVKDYGCGFPVIDYTTGHVKRKRKRIIMTNPPYKLAKRFVLRALNAADVGVGMLVRLQWLEGGTDHPESRYNSIFSIRRPSRIVIIPRMPAAKGRVVRKRAVFIAHCWVWWDNTKHYTQDDDAHPEFIWAPPDAQRLLERDEDYERIKCRSKPRRKTKPSLHPRNVRTLAKWKHTRARNS